MPLEVASLIHELNPANPTGADPKSQGDDHIRTIKTCLLNTLPNIDGIVTASHTELNQLTGLGLTAGLYTPTWVNTTGITGVTFDAPGFRYTRVGNIVSVQGRMSVTTGGAGGAARISLPIARTAAATIHDGGGFGISNVLNAANFIAFNAIVGDTDEMSFSVGSAGGIYIVNFSYKTN